MKIYNPFYQLEVRYSPIFNFSSFSREVIAPYVKLTSRIGVDNENSFKENIQLIAEEDKYMIVISWDKIYLRSQGDIEEMTKENSVVETVFLPLLNDILGKSGISKIENSLLFVTTVNLIDDRDFKPVNAVADKFLKNETKGLLSNLTDIAIELVEKDDDHEITMTFGPYLGYEKDLKNRKTKPTFKVEEIDLEKVGQMAEIKVFEKNNKFTFQNFKELVKKYQKYHGKL